MIFETSMIMFHVNLQGCIHSVVLTDVCAFLSYKDPGWIPVSRPRSLFVHNFFIFTGNLEDDGFSPITTLFNASSIFNTESGFKKTTNEVWTSIFTNVNQQQFRLSYLTGLKDKEYCEGKYSLYYMHGPPNLHEKLAPTQKQGFFLFKTLRTSRWFSFHPVFQTESSQTPPGWLVGFGSLDLRVAVAWLHPKKPTETRGLDSNPHFPSSPKKHRLHKKKQVFHTQG